MAGSDVIHTLDATQTKEDVFQKALQLLATAVPEETKSQILLPDGTKVEQVKVDAGSNGSCTDPRKHRREGTHSTPKYGLLYAARAGCLSCVRDTSGFQILHADIIRHQY
eukprot:gnl/TRDRNA2_/TRDRNA2_167988_c0_seq2.p1 gnl/TRDRNA2_/TRDRNA2_167988_c0~~gnl/TRDRNA2_/TRDRNA2_167988_c0_seq2.p1  ORF type:complete len:110 (-),score=10.85 gnl/TRDRNA2_/TRDRNA2_167988_c0_seq2:55-384(-)